MTTEALTEKQRILVVDDNIANVELLEAYLSAAQYDVVKAFDGQEGLDKVHETMPDLILLDIMMPKLDGYEVCKQIKEDERTRFIPVVMITALTELEAKIKGLDVGADDFLSKPFNRLELMARVRSLLRIKSLHDDLDSSEDIIFTLALALEAKDTYTAGHSERVAGLARELAEEIGLSEEIRGRIHKAGILHDIGKIGVREAILNKEGRLDEEEYNEVTSHPSVGANICEPLKSLSDIIPMIKHHHERYDGTGHPDGLAGEDIPLGARIISIADTFDAMTSARPYRAAMDADVALKIMESELPEGQWDEKLLKSFISIKRNNAT
ncbi:MAG: response regulator [Proteobacteria bacterium]|nr:response regulator [Pseudomonadota bacterium]